MTRSPKAFRSVAAVLILWVTGRVLTMMPDIVEADVPSPDEPERSATEEPVDTAAPVATNTAVTPQAAETVRSPRGQVGVGEVRTAHTPTTFGPLPAGAIEQPQATKPLDSFEPNRPAIVPVPLQGRSFLGEGWSASGWLLYRDRSQAGAGLVPNGQLGGSQAGVRIRKTLFDAGSNMTLGASVRASTSLGSVQREVAVGGSLRIEGRVPVEIIAERRFGLDAGTRDRFVLLGATGVDDVHLPAKALLSGYAQAGIAGTRSRDGFADGSVRVERRLVQEERLEVRAGANLWGAVQPGLSRVDVGPSVSVKLDTPGAPMRVSVEWRQRLSGNAAPASGPAITVGADF